MRTHPLSRRHALRWIALSPAFALLASRPALARSGPGSGSARRGGARDAAAPASLEVGYGERLLVVAPHPDDETIGTGGLIQRVVERGGSALVVLVTAGDGFVDAVVREARTGHPKPAQYIAYGERRIREARSALRALASRGVELEVLGFPDGGLAALLGAHWSRGNPLRSRTTGATDPPYDDEVLAPDLPYDGSDLRAELLRIVRAERPTLVAVPDPLDTHPDHHAAGVFGLLAVADAGGGADRGDAPEVLSYLVHWPAWPPGADGGADADATARGTHGADRFALHLPEAILRQGGEPVALELDDAERERKRVAMSRHASQQAVSPAFLDAFVCRTEPFRRLGAKHVQAAAAGIGGAGHERLRTATR